MMLKDKVAVIYGAGGAIGGAVAHAFAREGATLYLTGHLRAPVEAVAREIVATGGCAALAEIADMAVFMASDKASGMTGTTVNLTMGTLDD